MFKNKHRGSCIFVIGSGPQLRTLTEKQISKLEKKIAIGVNETHYKIWPKYWISSCLNGVEIFMKRKEELSKKTVPIVCDEKRMKEALDEKLVKKLNLIPNDNLWDGFKGETISKETVDKELIYKSTSIIVPALELALVMGACTIICVGVEMKTVEHFYNSKDIEKDRKWIVEKHGGTNKHWVKTIRNWNEHLSRMDLKPNDNFFSDTQLDMGYYISVKQSLQRIIEVARDKGIFIYNTAENSILADLGCEFIELGEII